MTAQNRTAGERRLGFSSPCTVRGPTSTTCLRRRCAQRPPRAELGRVLVVGANRGLGLELARVLSTTDGVSSATCTKRPDGDADELSSIPNIDVAPLQVRDRDAVINLIRDFKPDVVFSCFGGLPTDHDRPDYPGNQNLIDASDDAAVKRFMLVSALGASESEGSVPFQVMDTMRPLLLDKSRAELYLRESKLTWTIVRPVPFSDDDDASTGMLTEGIKCYGTITRKETARLLVAAADSTSAARKTLTAIDRARVLLTSPYVRPLEFWEPLPVDEFDLT